MEAELRERLNNARALDRLLKPLWPDPIATREAVLQLAVASEAAGLSLN